MTYWLYERLSDSLFHGDEWQPLGIVNSKNRLDSLIASYIDSGFELFLKEYSECSQTYSFLLPGVPVLPNPVKPCPCGLNNPQPELFMFKQLRVDKDPFVLDTLSDYAVDMAR